MLKKLKKICAIFLVITLISGILSSAFGVSVLAINSKDTTPVTNTTQPENEDSEQESEETYVAPTEGYEDLANEVALNDEVIVLSDEEADAINDSIVSVESGSSYYEDYILITLNGTEHAGLEEVSYDDVIYLQGDEETPLGGDRILQIDRIYSYGEQTQIRASEPYFEDVFESLEICSSDFLTESNLVNASYADGVSSYFGDIEKEMAGVPKDSDLGTGAYQVVPASTNQQYQYMQTASDTTIKGGDLIIELEGKVDNQKDEEKKGIVASLGLSGKFGIKDLAAHIVCDMPSVANFEELYFGLSGQTFVSVSVDGEVKAEAQPEASKKDTWLASFEGLNEKRYPLAVFHFKGKTPVKISNKAFENKKESIIPSVYLILYSDWEGNISVSLEAGFEYTHSFNNGLSVYHKGEPNLTFQEYPYERAFDVEDEDNLDWFVDLGLKAEGDVTLMGASVLFYVAGVNLAELSAARIGIQAECDAHIKASTTDKLEVLEAEDTEFYVRGYLKILEAKVKLKAEGKSFLSGLSADIDFQFGLLDLTLFEYGHRPDKFKPKVPVSSMEAPKEFESVMSIVCDVSGSMNSTISSGQTKLAAAKEAAKVIVSSTEEWAKNYTGNYGIGVVMFSDYAETVAVPHIDYTFIKDCLDYIKNGGGTSVHSGIDNGVSQLNSVESTNKVMILMTDGQDYNDSATIASAKKAAEEDIKIYTVGFGNDVDEELLKEIAEITDGEYRYANTDNIIGIIGSFMYAQQASNADVLAEMEDTVAEGETTEAKTFEVADANGNLMATTAWPGSFLDTILIDPNGREVDETYPGSVTDESKIPSTITVENPIPGKWSIKVKGVETSYDEEPFYTIVSFKETEGSKINDEMKGIEKVAAYCMSVGAFSTVSSILLLCCFGSKKKKSDKN